MDDKQELQQVVKKVGRKHITLLREALTDKGAIQWFDSPRQMLGGQTPRKVILGGDLEKVRAVIVFCYDYSNLPKDEPSDEVEEIDVDED
jgi:hypothetical protein